MRFPAIVACRTHCCRYFVSVCLLHGMGMLRALIRNGGDRLEIPPYLMSETTGARIFFDAVEFAPCSYGNQFLMEVLGSELSSELRESLDRCASSALPCSEIATSLADTYEAICAQTWGAQDVAAKKWLRSGGQEMAPKKWRPSKWRTTDHAMRRRAGRARLRRYAGHKRRGVSMSCRAGGGRSCSYPFSVRSGDRFRRGRCAR